MRDRSKFFVLFYLTVVASALYAKVLSAPFMAEDYRLVLGNPGVVHTSFLYLWRWDPTTVLANITLALNAMAFPISPLGFHLINLLLHVTASFLVFILVGSLREVLFPSFPPDKDQTGGMSPEVFAAGIFLLHPLATSTVCYIAARSVLLFTVFYFGSLTSYLRFRLTGKTSFLIVSGSMAALGVFSHPAIISLPLAIVMLEYFLAQRKGGGNPFPVKGFWWLSSFCLLWLLVFGLSSGRSAAQGPFGAIPDLYDDGSSGSFLRNLLTQCNVLVKYLQLLVFPVSQNFDYDFPAFRKGLFLPTMLSLFGLALLFRLAVVRRDRTPWLSFSILWFFITVLPQSVLSRSPEIISETRLYLPLFGFTVLMSGAFAEHWQRASSQRIRIFYLMALTVLALLRVHLWSNPEWLWQDTIAHSPFKARPKHLLADQYLREGNFSSAQEQVMLAWAQAPEDAANWFYLGRVAEAQKNYREAIRFYFRAQESSQRVVRAKSLWRLGYLNFFQGKMAAAEDFYLKSLFLLPQAELVLLDLGNVYTVTNRWRNAGEEYLKALTINPFNFNARNGLAAVLIVGKNYPAAVKELFTLTRLFPKASLPYLNLGRLFLSLGQAQEAEPVLKQALEIDPHNPKVHFLLALLYLDLDLPGPSQRYLSQAIGILRAHGFADKIPEVLKQYEERKARGETKDFGSEVIPDISE